MRTVFICIPWFHPAFRAGGPVQSIANMVAEVDEDIQYKIFCGDSDLNAIPLENIETGRWMTYNKQTEVWYAKPSNRSETLLKLVKEIKPQTLFIVGIYSWHFNIVPILFCKAERKIVSVRGMLHPGALSQKKWKKKFYLAIFKLFCLQQKVSFHATDMDEKKHIQDLINTDAVIFIVGNFPRSSQAQKPVFKTVGKLQLTSVALISPMKNHLLVLEALQHCSLGIEYHIYGPIKDAVYWQLCLEKIRNLPSNIIVKYHGAVQPADVQNCLDDKHVFILPSKSENFGHAFYEALSAGKPVISSYNTPWQNLEIKLAGLNVNLDEGSVREAIVFFADMNNETYDRWSLAAIDYASNVVDRKKLQQQYLQMFFHDN